MKINVKQISSMDKVRSFDLSEYVEICKKTALAGERISYQISLQSDEFSFAEISAVSPLLESIRLYQVQNVIMDAPVTEPDLTEEDYLSLTPGLMPDLLTPLSETNDRLSLGTVPCTLWIRIDLPKDLNPGTYSVDILIHVTYTQGEPVSVIKRSMEIEVIPAVMPEQRLIYTRWFYADCIASVHHVDIFSEAHWKLMEKYIEAASDSGINMILVPIHTPPLDTAIGTRRPCVQLVDIEKCGEDYHFSFEKLERFITICRKHGIQYFEMAHMFSQWGAKCAPNILVTENGKTDFLFGWHVASDSSEYIDFLKQYIKALSEELRKLEISEHTYFHISDEPTLDYLETYQTAYEILKPLIGNSKTFDAISNYDFYEKGLVGCPVTSVEHIHEFLEHKIEDQWVYYCCNPQKTYTNCFIASPSYRTRILGFLLYKYDLKGFLHWGFNYYHSRVSRYAVDPYLTTSSDRAFPSGDPFIVYPSKDGVYPSIRGELTFDAIQDMNICFALEEKIGREQVIAMIDEAAGGELTFDNYPKCKEYLEALHDRMLDRLAHCMEL